MSGPEDRSVEYLWEAVDLMHGGHDVTGNDIRGTVGVGGMGGPFDRALIALDLLREAVPPEAAHALSPGDVVGGYRIERAIGRGGMGVVYEATVIAAESKRPTGSEGPAAPSVALKVLHPLLGSDPASVLRFKQEAAVARRLRHPHIATVFEVGQDGDLLYFVMQRVRGAGLNMVFPHEDAQTEAGLRDWAGRFAGIARALEHAHKEDVIHRDVKPSNILLDENGALRLVDFGIARPLDAMTLTASSMMLGTPLYMSPEQAAGRREDVGPATDVYALGATLFEVATGRPTVDPETDVRGVIHAIIETRPPRPRRLNANVPRDLEIVLEKALEKRPQDRYRSAADFAHDLECVARGAPIKTKPAGMIRRLRGWSRRRPTAAVAISSAVLFVALFAGAYLGGLGLGWYRDPPPPVVPVETWPELSRRAWLNYPSNTAARRWRDVGNALGAFEPLDEAAREERVVLRVWRALKEADGPAAIAVLDEAGAIPSARAALVLRGQALYRAWRIPESKPFFDRARATPSKTRLDRVVWAHHRLGVGGEAAAASTELDALVKEAPDYLPAHIVRIAALRGAREFDKALEVCGFLKIIGLDDPVIEVLRAVILDQKGDVDASIEAFRNALAREPENDGLRAQFIFTLQRRGRRELAEREIETGLGITPTSEWLLNARGWSHHCAKRFDEAITDYRKALGRAPHFQYSQVNLGNALIQSGRVAAGLAVWSEMLADETLPARNRAILEQEIAIHHWRQEDLSKAIAHTRRSLDACYSPAAHGNLILFLVIQFRHGEALPEAERLLALTPNSLEALAHRGVCKMFTYDLEGAAADLKRARERWRGEPSVKLIHNELLVQSLAADVETVVPQFVKHRERLLRAKEERDDFLYEWIDFLVRRTTAVAEARALVDEFYRLEGHDEQLWVDALDVQLVGREAGWAAAVARWRMRGVAKTDDATLDGRFAWLRLIVQGAVANEDSPHRTLCRSLLAGKAVAAGDVPPLELPGGMKQMAREAAARAWLAGRALLDADAAERAIPYLEAATRTLDLGACHLDLACAIAVARDTDAAAGALVRALAKTLPRLYAVKRLRRHRVAPTPAIRAPFLAPRGDR